MKPERKIVKTRTNGALDDSVVIKHELDHALSEYDKVKKIVDYFVLGLLMIVILYTMY